MLLQPSTTTGDRGCPGGNLLLLGGARSLGVEQAGGVLGRQGQGEAAQAGIAAPATTPAGVWLAEQRHLAAKTVLDQTRVDALTALAPYWRLPHGADWHRKYHLLRAHLASGADPAVLTRDTQLGGVKIGSWLHVCRSFEMRREPVGKRIKAAVVLADDPGGHPAGGLPSACFRYLP